MLLRRMIDHVKAQNWTAVALDFVIVVVGVFIGIQVANWNAARADQRRGAEYAERLANDMRTDLKGRRELLAYYDAVFESAERTVELLNSASPDPQALVVNAYRATEYAFNPQTRATWDEIVSSGDVGLLPHGAVGGRGSEQGLAYYFGVDVAEQVLEEMRQSPYRQRVRGVIPHGVQKAIRAGCGDVRDDANRTVTGFQTDCRLDVSEAQLAAAAEAIMAETDLLRDLRYQFSSIASGRANLNGDIAVLERSIRVLEGDDAPTEEKAPAP